MYRIISVNDGREIGVADAVTYIKVGESGSYTPSAKEDATGVAVNGTPYNLMGQDIGGEDTVVVSEFDGGALVAEQQRIINELLISSLEG